MVERSSATLMVWVRFPVGAPVQRRFGHIIMVKPHGTLFLVVPTT